MQYIRRRILRVSGVTVRDEHLERRDFSTSVPAGEEWGDFLARKNDDAEASRRPLTADWIGARRART